MFKNCFSKIVLAILICFVFIFTACQNFVDGNSLRSQIEEKIKEANAEQVSVLILADNQTGTTVPSGNQTVKVGYPFDVKFSEDSSYSFDRWVAVRESDGSPVTDVVEFEDSKSFSTKVTLKSNVDGLKIYPACIERIRVSGEPSPKLESAGVAHDRPISIEFNKAPATSSFIFDLNEIPENATTLQDEEDNIYAYKLNGQTFFKNISIVDENDLSLADHFLPPHLNQYNQKVLEIETDKTNPLSIDSGKTKIIKVYLKGNIKDKYGIYMNTPYEWSYLVSEVTEETAFIQFPQNNSSSEEGFVNALSKEYYIGQSIFLSFTEKPDYQFIKWDYDPSIVSIADETNNQTYAYVKDKTDVNGTGSIIKAVCETKLKYTVSPSNLVSARRDTPIEISFTKNVSQWFSEKKYTLTDEDGNDLLEHFLEPVYSESENKIYFAPNYENLLTVDDSKLITLKLPGLYYVYENDTKFYYSGSVEYKFVFTSGTLKKANLFVNSKIINNLNDTEFEKNIAGSIRVLNITENSNGLPVNSILYTDTNTGLNIGDKVEVIIDVNAGYLFRKFELSNPECFEIENEYLLYDSVDRIGDLLEEELSSRFDDDGNEIKYRKRIPYDDSRYNHVYEPKSYSLILKVIKECTLSEITAKCSLLAKMDNVANTNISIDAPLKVSFNKAIKPLLNDAGKDYTGSYINMSVKLSNGSKVQISSSNGHFGNAYYDLSFDENNRSMIIHPKRSLYDTLDNIYNTRTGENGFDTIDLELSISDFTPISGFSDNLISDLLNLDEDNTISSGMIQFYSSDNRLHSYEYIPNNQFYQPSSYRSYPYAYLLDEEGLRVWYRSLLYRSPNNNYNPYLMYIYSFENVNYVISSQREKELPRTDKIEVLTSLNKIVPDKFYPSTQSEKHHTSDFVLINAYGKDFGSGLSKIYIKENNYGTSPYSDNNDVLESFESIYEVPFIPETNENFDDTKENQAPTGDYSLENFKYQLKSSNDGNIKLTITLIDDAGNYSADVPSVYYVIKDTKVLFNVKSGGSYSYYSDPSYNKYVPNLYSLKFGFSKQESIEKSTYRSGIKSSNVPETDFIRFASEGDDTDDLYLNFADSRDVFYHLTGYSTPKYSAIYTDDITKNESEWEQAYADNLYSQIEINRNAKKNTFVKITATDAVGNEKTFLRMIPKEAVILDSQIVEGLFGEESYTYNKKLDLSVLDYDSDLEDALKYGASELDYTLVYKYKENEESQLSDWKCTEVYLNQNKKMNIGFPLSKADNPEFRPAGIYEIYLIPYYSYANLEVEPSEGRYYGTISKPYTIKIEYDESGNQIVSKFEPQSLDNANIPGILDFTVELDPPEVNKGTRNVKVKINENFEKSDGIKYLFAYKTTETGLTYSYSERDSFVVKSGFVYDVCVVARDSAGNVKFSDSNPIDASYDNIPPVYSVNNGNYYFYDYSKSGAISFGNNQYLPIPTDPSGIKKDKDGNCEITYYFVNYVYGREYKEKSLEGIKSYTVKYDPNAQNVYFPIDASLINGKEYSMVLKIEDIYGNYCFYTIPYPMKFNCINDTPEVGFLSGTYNRNDQFALTVRFNGESKDKYHNLFLEYFDKEKNDWVKFGQPYGCNNSISSSNPMFVAYYSSNRLEAINMSYSAQDFIKDPTFYRLNIYGSDFTVPSVYFYPKNEHLKNRSPENQIKCKSKNISLGSNGLQVFCDNDTLIEVYYSSEKIEADEESGEWIGKGCIAKTQLVSSDSTITLPEIPSGNYYWFVAHFADGDTCVSDVKVKR